VAATVWFRPGCNLYFSYFIYFLVFVFLFLAVFFLLFCWFMVASSMCLSGNREISKVMMMMMATKRR